ncbi:hypothetical protein RY831_25640 [Noviherbaspirillum sp. CPCC 100848]|uniref:Uncharacterized protein n=1 Tax=Noviherbaspirillum album TaxID=3080276 RepID=A0ABU6JFV3_9BURK|nr:hypothetical protein [Noviherbaspirillum sp. CPCC 100848]MEC4722554.1 hypothetical protein [Noviherbaspirillum sp. CPCC 100848]
MSDLEENLSVVVLWIRCTFIVLCIYGGAMLLAGCQMLKQWLSRESPADGVREAPPATAATPGKLPGSA